MAKYKTCTKCHHRNLSFAERCEHCNADLSGVNVQEEDGVNFGRVSTIGGSDSFVSFLGIYQACF